MADFYVKYGSKGARLVSSYYSGKVNLKLHQVGAFLYVLSKNRKIVNKYNDVARALAAFHNMIFMEAPDLFNN